MATTVIVFLLMCTTLPYAVGIVLSVYRDSPIPLIAALLVQRIGFIVFLAVISGSVMGTSSPSGVSVLCGFLLVVATSSLVLKPLMHTLTTHLVEQRRLKEKPR